MPPISNMVHALSGTKLHSSINAPSLDEIERGVGRFILGGGMLPDTIPDWGEHIIFYDTESYSGICIQCKTEPATKGMLCPACKQSNFI